MCARIEHYRSKRVHGFLWHGSAPMLALAKIEGRRGNGDVTSEDIDLLGATNIFGSAADSDFATNLSKELADHVLQLPPIGGWMIEDAH